MDNKEKKQYQKYADAHAPKSPILKNCIMAFLVGGLICVIGQALTDLYSMLNLGKDDVGTLTSMTLIFITALLTGIGIFDNIARHAGAGTLVPITGFANAVASPAVDTKSEGLVLGVGSKIFIIAGPVILYSTAAGALYGVIYWLYCFISNGGTV